MSANRKVKDLEEHAAAKFQIEVDKNLFPFEAAALQPPKLPDVSISVSVDTILGVDALLRNAIFQMGLGDTEGVRRSVQAAIAKLYGPFQDCGKALTKKVTVTPEMLPRKIVPPEMVDISANEFASLLCVSRDKVDSWIDWGMPHTPSPRRGVGPTMIPLLAGCAWVHDRIASEAPKGSEVRWPASWGQELGD